MSQLATNQTQAATLEQVLIQGDLAKLTPEQRTSYYMSVCQSVGLNHLTKPFDYIVLNGKLTLYAKRDCTDQLRKIHNVSIKISSRILEGDIYSVTALATDKTGRTDESVGAVCLGKSFGETKANLIMKAECVPLEYEILTNDGFKSALELSPGELVAAMDVEKKELVWTPLQQISIYENQNVTLFGNSAVEFEITPGHSWVTKQQHSEEYLLKPFEQIKDGTYIQLAAEERTARETLLNPKEAAALGWIVTDGTVKTYNGQLYRASICQGKKENFEHIEWALSEMQPTRGVTDNREKGWLDQHWWHLSKQQTQLLFHKAGYKSKEDLQSIAAKLNNESRAAMLEAMFRADGDKRNNFGKGDMNVISALQVLLALQGNLTSKISTRFFNDTDKPFFLTRKMSYQKVAKQNLEEQGSRITTVWCPTTKFGTWVTRTDKGQVMVTGNTKAKRRVTLSICGLGLLDETEVVDIPEIKNEVRGEVIPPPNSNAPSYANAPTPNGNTVGYQQRHDARMSEPATEAQRKKLYAMTRELGWDDTQAKDWMMRGFNIESSTQFTKSTIQDAFLMLDEMLNDSGNAG